jgi:hypothetical protein
MRSKLLAKKVWRIVTGESKAPVKTADNADDIEEWQDNSDMAAGIIAMALSTSQKVHLEGKETNPVGIWKALEAAHLHRAAGTRFNAYDELFSIRKAPDESLPSVLTRVEQAFLRLKALRPSSFTLAESDAELTIMASIRALPADEFGAFTSSLLLQPNLDKAAINAAFQNEEAQQ